MLQGKTYIVVLFYLKQNYCLFIYILPCISSQVDLTKCKNVTVFLAPSVVSNIINKREL